MKQDLKLQLDRLKAKGASYADARWYPSEESNTLFMRNGNLEALNASQESGLGVRVLYKGRLGLRGLIGPRKRANPLQQGF